MAEDATYKNITATVRPPRCAIFINNKSEHWQTAVDGAIVQASKVWGGRHFMIIPTDGVHIDEKFWELLEAYSPDFLAVYRITFADVEYSRPVEYDKVKREWQSSFNKQGFSGDFDEWFAGNAAQSEVDPLAIDGELDKELLQRLSPFHFNRAIDQSISRGSGFGYPFTKISEIITATTRHIGRIVLPKPVDDSTLALLVHSQTGIADDRHRGELNEQSFMTEQLPESYQLRDFLRCVLGGSAQLSIGEPQGWWSKGDYMPNMPFGISMLHLGHYYRSDRHMAHKEPVVVVIGDEVSDFCFYYSLSRIHENVLWLPLMWLRSCNGAITANRKRRQQGVEPQDLSTVEGAARVVIDLAFELAEYAHHEKRVHLRSMSLSKMQLVAYRAQMVRCATVAEDRLKSAIDVVPLEQSSTKCIYRVFEENNHVNYRSMVFVDGKSVSPFETPKPKNFNEIRLPQHHWLTSLEIEGYHPPSIPTLGPKIVNIHGMTTESRVDREGIVYNCPSIAHFGGDADVNTVRPKIEMPDVMELFNTYFEGTGITVGYSDKGNYFIDTLRRFGGLEATGKFIKAAATRGVLEKFMSKKVAEKGNVIFLDNDQRAYLNLGAITASLGDEKVAADLVDELVGKQVLQRGYIFQCERCRLISWYGVDVLTTDFTCNRCSLRQQFTRWHWRNPVVPHWYYRLAETIYQFYDNDSHLTAQVLYKLKLESTTGFHYAPEVDLANFAKRGKSREMDVACILDGQIIFGECKTETLKLDVVDKFEDLAKKPVKNPARIIFATTRPVSEAFRARAGKLPNAEIFTRSDLYDD